MQLKVYRVILTITVIVSLYRSHQLIFLLEAQYVVVAGLA